MYHSEQIKGCKFVYLCLSRDIKHTLHERLSTISDVIQPLVAMEKCAFIDWVAVVHGGCWLLLSEISCKEGAGP